MNEDMNTPKINFKTLDLNLLRVFDEIMLERNLTRAAERLSLTQPAVSNALKRLRDSLGDELVKRNGSGIEPTPLALVLWPQVRNALDQLKLALNPIAFNAQETEKEFVLAMSDATAMALMPELVRRLQTKAPRVAIRIVPLATRDPRKLLADGHADMALGHFPAVQEDMTLRRQSGLADAFSRQRLYRSDYVCILRSNHPLANADLSLDQYCQAHHVLVSLSGRPYGFIDQALSAIDRTRQVTLTVNQFYTALKIVEASDLLTVSARHFLATANTALNVKMKELPFQVPAVQVDVVWHQNMGNEEAHQWLREQLLEVAQDVFTV